MANSKTFPCKDCTDRCAGCHSSCEAYLNAKSENDKAKEYVRRYRDVDDFIIKSTIKHANSSKRIWR